MEGQELALYKLVVLYMLSRVDFPLKHSQISNFLLDKIYLHPEINTIEDMENYKSTTGFTNYVNLQQVLDELKDAEYIHAEALHNSNRYNITQSGLNLILMFEEQIPSFIKEEILSYFAENKVQLRNEVETFSTYYPGKNDEFIVSCSIKERNTILLELKLNVVSQEQALTACDNWNNNNSDIYAYLMKSLLKK